MATACSPSHCARSARALPKSCSRRPGGARLIIRAAAARPDGAASRQQTSGSAAARQQQLVRALLQAARKQVVDGWLSDLLLPLVSGDDGAAEPAPPTQPPQALGDPDSRFVAVDGVQLHYKEALPAGSGSSSDQPAICLIHGLNGSVFNWRMMMQSLANATGCRVIAFDRPPFGLAERPLEWGRPDDALSYNPYSLEGSARLAAGLLDALGVGRVVAVGHSAGALVAMELAQRQPGRVAGLGFVAPALPTTPENSFARRATLGQQLRFLAVRAVLGDDTLGLRYVRRQILRRRDEVAAGRLGLTSSDEDDAPQDVIEGYLKPLRAHDWDRASLLNFRAFSIPPAYDYAALAAPVLLVQGSEDGGLTQNARALAGLLQQRPRGSTQFVELQGVGHVPMEECGERLTDLLAEFVRREVAQPAAAASI